MAIIMTVKKACNANANIFFINEKPTLLHSLFVMVANGIGAPQKYMSVSIIRPAVTIKTIIITTSDRV